MRKRSLGHWFNSDSRDIFLAKFPFLPANFIAFLLCKFTFEKVYSNKLGKVKLCFNNLSSQKYD